MKALRAIGLKVAFRYGIFTLLYLVYRSLPVSQLRIPFLRLLGAKIGSNCVMHSVKFFNYYRTGFAGLTMGNDCFIGDESLLDLAAPLTLEDQVTLAERVLVLTHLNVGYADHPLQQHFPSSTDPVIIRKGSFLGAASVVLGGVEIGPRAFVAASALVNKSVSESQVVAGVPAKTIKTLS